MCLCVFMCIHVPMCVCLVLVHVLSVCVCVCPSVHRNQKRALDFLVWELQMAMSCHLGPEN